MRFEPRNTKPNPDADIERIRTEAAQWSDALRHSPDDAGLRAAFTRWQAASALHAAAFARIDAAYATALAAGPSRELLAMRSRSLSRVAALQSRRQRRRRVAGLAAAAALLLALVAIWPSDGVWQPADLQLRLRYALTGDAYYRTAVGERLNVSLGDGSRLALNTDSRVAIQYRDGQRGVRLLQGQAMFEVTRDSERPFVVHAGGRRVTALGTAFDVRLFEQRFEVTLIEGSVSVESDAPTTHSAPSLPPARLEPGERFVAAATRLPVIERADVRRAISWRDGQVIFENDPLADAVREMNRYGGPAILFGDDPSLAGLRISGAFNTGNTAGFVATLTSYFDVRVVEADERRIVLARRTPVDS